mmetsp:Transcript_5596/g.15084  ORF Transcript_5596/g.15084 Transcript_5596/m.15084 type:complete len:202 (-) Transcript_5596:1261-1866(-)
MRGNVVLHMPHVGEGEQHVLHPCAMGCKDLVADAAHREHVATQRDLSRDGGVAAHGPVQQQGGQGQGRCDPGGGPVLGNRSRWEVDVDVVVAEGILGRVRVHEQAAEDILELLRALLLRVGDRQVLPRVGDRAHSRRVRPNPHHRPLLPAGGQDGVVDLASQQRHRGAHTLAHDVPELPGDCQATGALAPRSLHEEELAAY